MIDLRTIKCAQSNPGTIESGISFDTGKEEQPVLRFHYMDYISGTSILDQRTKSMYLNRENIEQLISCLTDILNEIKQSQ